MTQKEILLEYNTQDVIEYIVLDFGIEFDEAMKKFYSSEVFEKLRDTETGLYLESPAYIYGLFQDECNFGKLVQSEI